MDTPHSKHYCLWALQLSTPLYLFSTTMKLLIQRVKEAHVLVEDRSVGKINKGLCVFVGFTPGDGQEEIAWASKKLLGLRLFSAPEKEGFEYNVEEAQGSLLIVSQFTLYGNCDKGRRPDFGHSMKAQEAKDCYEHFLQHLRSQTTIPIETGQFQAHMEVHIINDGPVTFTLEKHPKQG